MAASSAQDSRSKVAMSTVTIRAQDACSFHAHRELAADAHAQYMLARILHGDSLTPQLSGTEAADDASQLTALLAALAAQHCAAPAADTTADVEEGHVVQHIKLMLREPLTPRAVTELAQQLRSHAHRIQGHPHAQSSSGLTPTGVDLSTFRDTRKSGLDEQHLAATLHRQLAPGHMRGGQHSRAGTKQRAVSSGAGAHSRRSYSRHSSYAGMMPRGAAALNDSPTLDPLSPNLGRITPLSAPLDTVMARASRLVSVPYARTYAACASAPGHSVPKAHALHAAGSPPELATSSARDTRPQPAAEPAETCAMQQNTEAHATSALDTVQLLSTFSDSSYAACGQQPHGSAGMEDMSVLDPSATPATNHAQADAGLPEADGSVQKQGRVRAGKARAVRLTRRGKAPRARPWWACLGCATPGSPCSVASAASRRRASDDSQQLDNTAEPCSDLQASTSGELWPAAPVPPHVSQLQHAPVIQPHQPQTAECTEARCSRTDDMQLHTMPSGQHIGCEGSLTEYHTEAAADMPAPADGFAPEVNNVQQSQPVTLTDVLQAFQEVFLASLDRQGSSDSPAAPAAPGSDEHPAAEDLSRDSLELAPGAESAQLPGSRTKPVAKGCKPSLPGRKHSQGSKGGAPKLPQVSLRMVANGAVSKRRTHSISDSLSLSRGSGSGGGGSYGGGSSGADSQCKKHVANRSAGSSRPAHIVDGKAFALPSWLVRSPRMMGYLPPWERAVVPSPRAAVPAARAGPTQAPPGLRSPRNATALAGSPVQTPGTSAATSWRPAGSPCPRGAYYDLQVDNAQHNQDTPARVQPPVPTAGGGPSIPSRRTPADAQHVTVVYPASAPLAPRMAPPTLGQPTTPTKSTAAGVGVPRQPASSRGRPSSTAASRARTSPSPVGRAAATHRQPWGTGATRTPAARKAPSKSPSPCGRLPGTPSTQCTAPVSHHPARAPYELWSPVQESHSPIVELSRLVDIALSQARRLSDQVSQCSEDTIADLLPEPTANTLPDPGVWAAHKGTDATTGTFAGPGSKGAEGNGVEEKQRRRTVEVFASVIAEEAAVAMPAAQCVMHAMAQTRCEETASIDLFGPDSDGAKDAEGQSPRDLLATQCNTTETPEAAGAAEGDNVSSKAAWDPVPSKAAWDPVPSVEEKHPATEAQAQPQAAEKTAKPASHWDMKAGYMARRVLGRLWAAAPAPASTDLLSDAGRHPTHSNANSTRLPMLSRLVKRKEPGAATSDASRTNSQSPACPASDISTPAGTSAAPARYLLSDAGNSAVSVADAQRAQQRTRPADPAADADPGWVVFLDDNPATACPPQGDSCGHDRSSAQVARLDPALGTAARSEISTSAVPSAAGVGSLHVSKWSNAGALSAGGAGGAPTEWKPPRLTASLQWEDLEAGEEGRRLMMEVRTSLAASAGLAPPHDLSLSSSLGGGSLPALSGGGGLPASTGGMLEQVAEESDPTPMTPGLCATSSGPTPAVTPRQDGWGTDSPLQPRTTPRSPVFTTYAAVSACSPAAGSPARTASRAPSSTLIKAALAPLESPTCMPGDWSSDSLRIYENTLKNVQMCLAMHPE